MSYSKGNPEYTVRKVGQPYTLEHRLYIEMDGIPISPFHDIPLYANEQQTILNMVVEIPRWTNAKQEVRLDSHAEATSQPL
jgi:inorganic pyrophosphatase